MAVEIADDGRALLITKEWPGSRLDAKWFRPLVAARRSMADDVAKLSDMLVAA